jgi:DNA repair exonuclease SbcCD nuclease subunit
MERSKLNKIPTLICSADWHLREDTPVARTDDYWVEQWRKVDFISDLQKKYHCPVILSGDMYDHWKPSPNLLRETILHIPDQLMVCYGQHDLPAHSLDLVNKCGINVLEAAKKLTVLPECHWNQFPKEGSLYLPNYDCHILVWHVMNYQGKLPWPNCPSPLSGAILRKYPQFPLIITGDNHKSFSESFEGRWLINPGSLMRMDADQIDHRPCVYLWFAEDNTIEQVFIPIKQGVISREHLEREAERDGRIDAFVSRLDDDWEAALSFEQNVETFKQTNQVRISVMDIVYRSMEKVKLVL